MLGRDLVMVPKLIHPLPPATPRTRTEEEAGEALDIEEEPPTPHPSSNTWLEVGSRLAKQAWRLAKQAA